MNAKKAQLKGELVGLEIKIIDSKNRSNIGFEGKIIDETRNTLTIQTKENKKRLIKDQNTFEIRTKEKNIKINGELLIGRSEERIKKW